MPHIAPKKYQRVIRGIDPETGEPREIIIDVYDTLRAWNVTCPGLQHAAKKVLVPGTRGHKTAEQDKREAVVSIERSIEMERPLPRPRRTKPSTPRKRNHGTPAR